MELISPELSRYVEEHTSPESEILRKLNRETHANILKPIMLSGHIQGRVLSLFSKMIRPDRILEIGTYTGYSALCLSEGLNEGGKLVTIDVNEELESLVRKYFKDAGAASKIDYIIGNALEVIPSLEGQFDIVFIDADKSNYINYYHLCFDKLKNGGYIIADNVLWKGRVVDKQEKGRDLEAMKVFNKMVQEDTRVENVLLAIRDGLMIARKL